MSRIKGLNDRETLAKKMVKADITIWKGGKKKENSIGKNLDEEFRIEAKGYEQKIIEKCYASRSFDGSLFLKELNIVPAYSDRKKALVSEMSRYNAAGIVSLCDRETIHTEFIETKDWKGGIYRAPVKGDKLCPVAKTNHKCPHGCTLTGNFYFYILELLLAGSSKLCRLQTHAIEDNQAIASLLDEVQEDIGAIKKSPFTSEDTRSYIVYRLARKEMQLSRPVIEGKGENAVRTGKRFRKSDWAVSLELHPIWQNKYYHWLQAQELQARNLALPSKVTRGIYGNDFVEAEYRQIEQVSRKYNGQRLLPVWQITSADIQELRSLWQQNNWTEEGLMALLRSRFGLSSRNFDSLTRQQFEELKMALGSPEAKEIFCDF